MRLVDIEPLQKERWHLHRYVAGVHAARVEEMELEEVPTVDATPVKHGHWEDVGSLSCRCSECGCKNDRETRFCPNCGAKMDSDEV